MTIMMRMQWDGVTAEQYDEVSAATNLPSDPPKGGLLHEAWIVDNQLNICDVWETADDLDAFVANRLMPAVAKLGITSEPSVQVFPVHNWQLERPLEPGALVEEASLPAEGYKALEAKVGWRDVPPIGGISHIAAIEGDTIRTVTAWRSEADAQAFETDRIAPAAEALGVPTDLGAAEPVFHPLHNLFDAAGTLAAKR
jgi:hypothetical protein